MGNSNSTYNVSDRCEKCGKPFFYIGDPIGDIDNYICTCARKQTIAQDRVGYPIGWQCPICGQVMAPWVSVCSGYHGKIITSQTDITIGGASV